MTILGGLTIDPGAGASLSGSTVKGGITVGRGAELDIGVPLGGGALLPGSTISGNIEVDHSRDFDMYGSSVAGSLSIDGSGENPYICGNTFTGGVTVADGSTNIGLAGSFTCSPNTIGGSLRLNRDIASVGNNAIGGSLLCEDTLITFVPNTIGGANTCY